MNINPWVDITSSKRFLECDKLEIESYNKRRTDNPLCLDDFPEPFLGTPDADVYLLLGNPGFDAEAELFSYNATQIETIKNNLAHSNTTDDYPLYLLSPEFITHPGFAWWHKAFQPLAKELQIEMVQIAKTFFCIELYGYHSATGDDKIAQNLPSVNYSKKLITDAMKQYKIIIICRGATKWLTLIPELNDYELCSFLASNRGIALSKSTISPPIYKRIRQILLT